MKLETKQNILIEQAISINKSLNKKNYLLIKRIADIGMSLFVLFFSLPLMAILAVLIKLESKGPIFYTQTRVGKDGKLFNVYKLRTMYAGTESEGGGARTLDGDPRITKIGKIIRKYSLDELPQLFNVIRGEMSLVGPRPPLMSEVENYNAWHYLKFATLPGLTGMWQVNGRAKIKNFDTVVKLDYSYIDKWNLKLDFYLLFKTIPVVILAKGAA